ncbi:unnamed protein product [Tilletia controversa]|uniref:Uncharacterized protein n=3 Tax=Tilletia TaxID=13289 RepID=A0A8X7MRW0_9BASI|nr:hypothetical protein CF336_g4676 [Tilletia laevis]KAE8195110.1 hypothetical protein CF328_g4542 [Tilletia controversa]KAE8261087.1 hypothetical protein A4X03_0g3556 [Tilletia caries]KAE8199554.1 hypothetical protein CF335_g4144 [Tilletia laevis]KAE8247125.1 hypothetical protein A4X06_0g4684 [Tilletia controversa]
MSSAPGQHVSAAKERHYAHLAARLAAVSQTLSSIHGQVEIAAQDAQFLRTLGTSQAALFMAAQHQVEGEPALEEGEEQF